MFCPSFVSFKLKGRTNISFQHGSWDSWGEYSELCHKPGSHGEEKDRALGTCIDTLIYRPWTRSPACQAKAAVKPRLETRTPSLALRCACIPKPPKSPRISVRWYLHFLCLHAPPSESPHASQGLAGRLIGLLLEATRVFGAAQGTPRVIAPRATHLLPIFPFSSAMATGPTSKPDKRTVIVQPPPELKRPR